MFARVNRGPDLRRDPARLPVDATTRVRRRESDRVAVSTAIDPFVRDAAMARVEAALFCGEEPVSLRRLTALAEVSHLDAQRAIDLLISANESEPTAFQIVDVAGGYQLLTRQEYFPWLVRLRQVAGEMKLSAPLLETLAIVAYRQPIMRADLEAVRGVHCGDALRELMERGLVRIVGRDDSLGRPILYGTTKKFLQVFALRDLSDLPELESGKS